MFIRINAHSTYDCMIIFRNSILYQMDFLVKDKLAVKNHALGRLLKKQSYLRETVEQYHNYGKQIAQKLGH